MIFLAHFMQYISLKKNKKIVTMFTDKGIIYFFIEIIFV